MQPLEFLQSVQSMELMDEDGNDVSLKLYPGLSEVEIQQLEASLPCQIPEHIAELLRYARGIEGLIENVDFSGRDLDFEHEVFPYGLPIAHDGFGNYWVVDLNSGSTDWAPIYFACHDAPVILLQSYSLIDFLEELVKMFVPPFKSLVDDVHEDSIFSVWRANPNVLTKETCVNSEDRLLRDFARELEDGYQIIDMRNCEIGFGFSWGRYGPRTETKRFNESPIFAYKKPENHGFFGS